MPTLHEQTITISNLDRHAREQVTFTITPALHHNNGIIPPKGISLVCGDKAYPYLPKGWAGSCYLASVFPDGGIKTTFHQTSPPLRYQRSTSKTLDPKGWAGVSERLGPLTGTWWEKTIGFLFPGAGMVMNSDRIDKLSLALEYVANVSMAYYTELSGVLVSMRTMVMQKSSFRYAFGGARRGVWDD